MDVSHIFEVASEKLLAPLLASALTALYLRASAAPAEVRKHNERAHELAADLTRWVRDEKKIAEAEYMGWISPILQFGRVEAYAAKYASASGGATIDIDPFEKLAENHESALRDYRDQAILKIRQYGS
jgi:hypothetical protein